MFPAGFTLEGLSHSTASAMRAHRLDDMHIHNLAEGHPCAYSQDRTLRQQVEQDMCGTVAVTVAFTDNFSRELGSDFYIREGVVNRIWIKVGGSKA